MLTVKDFEKKQIVFVFSNEGEKITLLNGNMTVRDKEDKIKLQITCYRLFSVFIVGQLSITTAFIQEAKRFGFFLVLLTSSFRLNMVIGAVKDANTMLKERQYAYDGLDIGKRLIMNKIAGQYINLSEQRNKSDYVKDSINLLKKYYMAISDAENRSQLMAYEGLASKVYFKGHFNNLAWKGRQPRIKKDWINSTLDIGYTILFAFIEALLSTFGFDVYRGFLHTQFYMRKSLVCDFVEPFRPSIDKVVRKAYNLKQIDESDFVVLNHQYQLQWKLTPKYVRVFLDEIVNQKELIFEYVYKFYHCFMRGAEISAYPFVYKGGISCGFNQL